MKIEFLEKVTLVHIKPGDARQAQCEVLQRQLIETMGVPCIFVPNGEPTGSYMPSKIFRKSNKVLMNAIKKLCRSVSVSGSYVPLDNEEFVALARAKADGQLVEL